MQLEFTTEQLLANFILIGLFVSLGILFRRIKAFPNDTAQTLNMFALYVSLPAVILLKAPDLSLTGETVVAAIVPWCMLLVSAAIILLLSKHCRWSRPTTGVLMLVVMEISFTTPPFGLLIYVMKGVAPASVTLRTVYLAALPFIFLELAVLGLILAWPGLVTWLPLLVRPQ